MGLKEFFLNTKFTWKKLDFLVCIQWPFRVFMFKKTLKFNTFLENLYSWIRIQEVSLSVDLDPRHWHKVVKTSSRKVTYLVMYRRMFDKSPITPDVLPWLWWPPCRRWWPPCCAGGPPPGWRWGGYGGSPSPAFVYFTLYENNDFWG